jgi:hypothetical protein
MNARLERIEMALGAMGNRPRWLRGYLEKPGPEVEVVSSHEIDELLDMLLSPNPNDLARVRFSDRLRGWDNVREAGWTESTPRNTADRRQVIHRLLRSDESLRNRIDLLIPHFPLEEPLVVAEEHEDWYVPREGARDYYWRTYCGYLRQKRGWDDASILNLDNATRAIVECLANPEQPAAYASRGLVMGYVQSGKTANFTGVVARAADAGYRLVIVLAGTWNILRNQTQRRLDKDLLGKELLRNDESYVQQPPSDWSEFLEHGTDPAQLGHYVWQRLTRPDIDFKRLKTAIDNLEFERTERALPLYHPRNLHSLPVKLLVVKKHSGILANLVKDLKLLKTKLADLPTLIIDDESDQAGLNTVNPASAAAGGRNRSETNLRIVDLLALFPRGQYIGYTATPYANALVDPDDPEDLFPKDFIVSLERPREYMGVSDFFDPTVSFDDLDRNDFSQPEIAHIRRVENPVTSDDEDLKAALRSYLLAGGIKLFRRAADPQRYGVEQFKHHTMLVHTSQRVGEQTSIASRLKNLWDECAFNTPAGLSDLEQIWNVDHAKVCAAYGKEVTPGSIGELIPYLSEAIKRIESGPKIFLVVNSDSPEAPDFSAAPVWKVLVGGNKLSRGYTIEGLTVSYYRRVAGTADTLMQMGRWFGFRPGYRDLVRVFLGVKEGRHGNTDLVALFKEVCRMEERFRDELKRYVRRPGAQRLTPKEIPPLISVTGNLPPTARNKMFNAVLASKNFGGQRSMPTLIEEGANENIAALGHLIAESHALGFLALGGTFSNGRSVETNAVVLEISTDGLTTFLRAIRWIEPDFPFPKRPLDISLQIEFLEKQSHGITGWLIVAPQRRVSFGKPLTIKGQGITLAVKERHRIDNRGFQVFGEPLHRAVAAFLSGLQPNKSEPELESPNETTKSLRNLHRGVCLLYPVRQQEADKVSVGYELLFPENSMPVDLSFTVRRRAAQRQVVVQT